MRTQMGYFKRSKNHKLVYINNYTSNDLSDKLVNEIHDLFFEYCKKTYEIFDYKSKI